MKNTSSESVGQQVSAELNHYFGVVGAATSSIQNSLLAGLGREVLDAEDRALMFPADLEPIQTPIPNNVIPMPPRAVAEQIEAVPAEAQPIDPTPLGEVTPIQDFPPITPPFANAA